MRGVQLPGARGYASILAGAVFVGSAGRGGGGAAVDSSTERSSFSFHGSAARCAEHPSRATFASTGVTDLPHYARWIRHALPAGLRLPDRRHFVDNGIEPAGSSAQRAWRQGRKWCWRRRSCARRRRWTRRRRRCVCRRCCARRRRSCAPGRNFPYPANAGAATCHLQPRRPQAAVAPYEVKRQMSRTPEVAWWLALPSGRAMRPSTMMGLFQCPEPQSRVVMRCPDAGR